MDEEYIKKDKKYHGIDEEIPEIEPETEEESIINNKYKDEEKDYLMKALDESSEEELAMIKYRAINLKHKEGKQITDEEKEFVKDMNALFAQEQEQQKELEEKIQKQKEQQEQLMKDYNIAKKKEPEKIEKHVVSESFKGGDSVPKLLKFAFMLKTAKKKGGKILVKVTRDRNVFLEWTLKEVNFVEFFTKDEKGDVIPEITRVNEFKYNYEGSPIPVLFAIQGYAETFDFFNEFRKDITSEMVSRIASRARHSGFLEGINQRDQNSKKNNLLATLTEFMPLILILGLLVMGWLMMQMYGEMTALHEAIEALKTSIPMVVQ
jgi:hypothetical protein